MIYFIVVPPTVCFVWWMDLPVPRLITSEGVFIVVETMLRMVFPTPTFPAPERVVGVATRVVIVMLRYDDFTGGEW